MAAPFKRFAPEFGLLLAVAAALALARSGASGRGRALRASLDAIALPLQGNAAQANAGLLEAARGWEKISALQNENRQLKQQSARAAGDALELARLRDEQTRLAALLALQAGLPLRTRGARLSRLSRGVQGDSALITGLNLGALGAEPRALLTPRGILGRTLNCAGDQCRVQLLTDPGAGIGVIDARSHLLFVATGSGAGTLILRGVGPGDDVKAGDSLLSNGLDGLYPRGLPVGTVVRYIAAGAAGPEGEVHPAADPGDGLDLLVVEGGA